MNRVKIGIDKKTELMGVLLYVSNYRRISKFDKL